MFIISGRRWRRGTDRFSLPSDHREETRESGSQPPVATERDRGLAPGRRGRGSSFTLATTFSIVQRNSAVPTRCGTPHGRCPLQPPEGGTGRGEPSPRRPAGSARAPKSLQKGSTGLGSRTGVPLSRDGRRRSAAWTRPPGVAGQPLLLDGCGRPLRRRTSRARHSFCKSFVGPPSSPSPPDRSSAGSSDNSHRQRIPRKT